MTNTQSKNDARELKTVSLVIAALALPVFGSTLFLHGWDARTVSLYVGSSILAIALGLRFYAGRPAAFGARTVGDPLRTRYHQPEQPAIASPLPATVPSREPVWTREYVSLVARQALAVVAVLTLNITLAAGVTLILARSSEEMFFIAAVIILCVFFAVGSKFVTGPERVAVAPVTELAPEPVLQLQAAEPAAPSGTHAA